MLFLIFALKGTETEMTHLLVISSTALHRQNKARTKPSRNPELSSDLLCIWQGSKPFTCSLLPPWLCISRNVDWKRSIPTLNHTLWCGMRVLQVSTLLLPWSSTVFSIIQLEQCRSFCKLECALRDKEVEVVIYSFFVCGRKCKSK